MNRPLAAALATGAAAMSLFAAAGPAAAASPIVGHTYVNGNGAGPNTVLAYDRHADGSLTTTPGSPFATGGRGLGGGLGSQGSIQRSDDGRYLLTVNAGSDSFSVLRIAKDGGLTPVGEPVPSGGRTPVSIAVHDDLVYVANAGDGGENYTGFRLDGKGAVQPVLGSTFPLPDGSDAGDILFDPTGKRLVGTRDTSSLIDSFKVHGDGRISPGLGSPTPAEQLGPIGAQFSPTHPSQLFVSNAHGGPGTGSISAFDVDRAGRLDSIGGGVPFANGQTATCWVEITADGRYLFAVNTAARTLSRYALAADGTPTFLGNTPFTNGMGATDLRLSPDGTTLSIIGRSAVSVFAVDGGDLTEIGTPTATPAGTTPTGIVVT